MIRRISGVVCVYGMAVALMFAWGSSVAGQSRRSPNAAEIAVLTRFIDGMKPILDRFADSNWQVQKSDIDEDATTVSISIRPLVPLDNCLGGTRTWEVPQGSPRFNERLKPLYDRVQAVTDAMMTKYKNGQDGSAEAQQIERLHQQIKQSSQVTMDLCANSPNVDKAALPANEPSLASGVIAHKVGADACGGQDAACYVLLFGDWTISPRSTFPGTYGYHFVHAAGTPYIENIVIKLHGADDRIQELLKAIDWTRVNQALTK